MKTSIVGLTLVVAVLMVAPRAHAGGVALGVQGSWGDETDFAVGARVIADLSDKDSGLSAIGSFDYYFPRANGLHDLFGLDLKYWEVNANLVYGFAKRSNVEPYAGVGLGYAHASVTESAITGITVSDNNVGLNLVGGLNFGAGKTKFFTEAKYEARGGGQFVVTAGIRF